RDWSSDVCSSDLENAIFRAVVLAQTEELSEADFPQIAAQLPEFQSAELRAAVAFSMVVSRAPEMRQVAASPITMPMPEGFIGVPAQSQRADPRALLAAAYPAASNVIASTDIAGEVRKLSDVEEELIRFALKFYRGQMSQVARKLGIGRSTLYRKLKDYGIDPDNPLKVAA